LLGIPASFVQFENKPIIRFSPLFAKDVGGRGRNLGRKDN